jgi:hypothetical protein
MNRAKFARRVIASNPKQELRRSFCAGAWNVFCALTLIKSSGGIMASAKATIDHDTIRKWVEGKGGCPAQVKRTRGKNNTGILRIDFPGYSGKETLEQISWDEFFKKFEEEKLAFLYQDEPDSRFNKLVKRDSVEVEEKKKSQGSTPKKRQQKRPAQSRQTRRGSNASRRARG